MNAPTEKMVDMGEREFRELADNAPVMIWRSRPDKLCDWFNKPWQDFAGKTLEQLFGYGWAEDVHPEDFDRCVATYVAAFDAREPFTMPYRLRRHDGVYRWFLDNGAPFYRNGEFAGYFGSCIDITEQRELEEHQRVLLAELNHRVKNNLQLILSFLQLSKLRAVTDESKELLQSAISRVQGVGILQNELYKSSGGAVDLDEYLISLARSNIDAEGSGSFTLESDTHSIKTPYDLASNLGLVVNELVMNSIKHSGVKPGSIYLALHKVGANEAELVVADNGKGFSLEAIDATTGNTRGNALINALVRRCHATLTRENKEGSVVRVKFPIEDSEESN
jgi:PAS domain S-box-containing protein